MKKLFSKIIPVLGLLILGGTLGACSNDQRRSHRGPSVTSERHYVYRAAPRTYSTRTYLYNARRPETVSYNRYDGVRHPYRTDSIRSVRPSTYPAQIVSPRSHRYSRY